MTAPPRLNGPPKGRARLAALLLGAVAGPAFAQSPPAVAGGTPLDGTFTGLVVCGAQVDRIQLTLATTEGSKVSGTVQRQPWLNAPHRQASGGAAVPVIGIYVAATGLFQLRTPAAAAPTVHDGALALRGGLQPGGDGLVAAPPGGGGVAAGRTCNVVVARRGSTLPAEWQALEREAEPGATGGMASMLLQLPEKLEQGRDFLRRECAAPLMPWLQQLHKLSTPEDLLRANVALLMFADESFVPHFGKRFAALSAQERMAYRVQQSGSCARDPRMRDPQMQRIMPNELLRAFHNMRDFPDVAKAAAAIPLGELRRWRDAALASLPAPSAVPGDAATYDLLLQWGRVLVEPLWLAEGRAFEQAVKDVRDRAWVHQLAQEFEAAKPYMLADLLTMNRVARGFASAQERYPALHSEDLAPLQAAITAFVREHVMATADAWAAKTSSPAQARLMAEAPGSLPGIAARLEAPQREALRELLAAHRRDLVVRMAQAERQLLQQRAAAPNAGAASVAELVHDEQRLAREYGDYAELWRETPFAELAAERAALRQDLLARAAPELEALAQKAPHGRELARLRATYLLPQDAAGGAGARFAAALDARADQVAPFRRLPAGAFFDALYADDAEGVAAFDAEVAARYREAWEQTKPMYQILDLIVSAAGGQRRVQPVVSEHVQRAYDRASLITPIMALYLGRYGFEDRYKRCIESDAEPRAVRFTTVEVKKRWGFESRSVTSDETVVFVINKRFKAVADELGVNFKQSEGVVDLERLFFSPDAAPTTDDALRGVRALMSQFDCDSEVVKRLEPRMIRHFLHR
ncbi:MAG: hypothetical protein QM750_12415 [Rubrivivax sp.]